jgi:hypothetical protein
MTDPISDLIDTFARRLSQIGCHTAGVMMTGVHNNTQTEEAEPFDPSETSPTDVVSAIKNETGTFALLVTMQTRDLAWTPQVLDPEGYARDQEAAVVFPTTAEMIRDSLAEQLRAGVKRPVIPDHLKNLLDGDNV